MDPHIAAPHRVTITFLSPTQPTDLQAAQLAPLFHAKPQAMINNLARYTAPGKPWQFQVIGRTPLSKGVFEEQVHHGVALLPCELLNRALRSNYRRPSVLISVIHRAMAGEDFSTVHDSAIRNTAALAKQLHCAVKKVHPGDATTEVELYEGDSAVLAIHYRSVRKA